MPCRIYVTSSDVSRRQSVENADESHEESQKITYEELWEENFQALKAHVESWKEGERQKRLMEGEQQEEIYDGPKIPPIPEDERLRRWLDSQRAKYKHMLKGERSSMTAERREKIESLGYWLDRSDGFWHFRYNQLCHFVNVKGQAPDEFDLSDMTTNEEKLLWYWCKKQKERYRNFRRQQLLSPTHMTPEKIKLLERVGFVWNSKEAYWMERFNELRDYVNNHGHANVPGNYPSNQEFATWVIEQRKYLKNFSESRNHSDITPRKIKLLNEIGFVWDVHEHAWMANYAELSDYVKINGLGAVPTKKENRTLQRWVLRQRELYTKKHEESDNNSLSDEREELLNKLGFPWRK